jgi:hypothetical protein
MQTQTKQQQQINELLGILKNKLHLGQDEREKIIDLDTLQSAHKNAEKQITEDRCKFYLLIIAISVLLLFTVSSAMGLIVVPGIIRSLELANIIPIKFLIPRTGLPLSIAIISFGTLFICGIVVYNTQAKLRANIRTGAGKIDIDKINLQNIRKTLHDVDEILNDGPVDPVTTNESLLL